MLNENKNFALVPRPPGAVEKVEPGAKRVLSGMVSDTLALAKKEPSQKTRPLRIVMVNDEEGVLQYFEVVIRHWFKDATMLMFDNVSIALAELSQTAPDLLITRDRMPMISGMELCQRLLNRQVSYPIIVFSGWKPTEEIEQLLREFARQGLNVSFLAVPCDAESILKAVETALKIPRAKIEKSVETAPQPRRTHPPRIVVLDDEEGPRRWHLAVLKGMYEGQTILDFEDSDAAWQELLRTDPDLFITDIRHVGISGIEMLKRLAERKVKYPIMVVSVALGFYEEDVRRGWGPGLNVSFLEKPVDIETYRKAVEVALQIPARRNNEK
jgi:FixJ family two-component response regulator